MRFPYFIIILASLIIIPVYADTSFNDEIVTRPLPAPPVNHDHILMIVSNWPFVVQGHVYGFQLRTFDKDMITKTVPLEEFKLNEAMLQGVSINATLYDSQNDTLYKFSGITNQFGWFSGSVMMENEPSNQVYHVVFTAAYPHMVNSTKTFSFELVDHRDIGEIN
jgi:hypothetical protein